MTTTAATTVGREGGGQGHQPAVRDERDHGMGPPLEEHRANMRTTVDGIKELAEAPPVPAA